MQDLYNNGYVVKGLIKNQYTSLIDCYRGMESFVSWPLDDFDDLLSKELQDEAWDKWFAYHDILEVVPEKEYLSKYVNHCKELGIETMILKIETPNNNQISLDSLKIIEELGFDCITGVQLSYLNLEPSYFEKRFFRTYQKLNSNRLLNTIDEIYEFLDVYNRLLDEGENLEYGDNPVPAFLSVVEL